VPVDVLNPFIPGCSWGDRQRLDSVENGDPDRDLIPTCASPCTVHDTDYFAVACGGQWTYDYKVSHASGAWTQKTGTITCTDCREL
jgi:hypothetical protein